MKKPIASLSLDLDNQWSYQKTHGDRGWESFPSYLDILVPRVLRFLEERELKITVFVVGQDAALAKNRAALGALARAGHEIGNHSFRHEPWLHLYPEQEIEEELARAEQAIGEATGQRPIGFRGPGFSLSETTLRVLARRGYLYDATTLPTFIGPLARAYYFMTAKLSPEERRLRRTLFGSIADGFRPLGPYRWLVEGRALVELPVTTMPLLRTPIHVSYLLYLGAASPVLARRYFELALWLCGRRGVEPSLILHPLDFLGADDTRALDFFPGMRLPSAVKLARVSEHLDALGRRFTVRPVREHVGAAASTRDLLVVAPRFAPAPAPAPAGLGRPVRQPLA